MSDRQAHFNQAFLGLARQGFQRAHSPDAGTCVLLDTSGRRCAIGHVVTDAKLGAASSPEADALLGGPDALFYIALRSVHDRYATRSMGARLRRFAKRWRLQTPALESPDPTGPAVPGANPPE